MRRERCDTALHRFLRTCKVVCISMHYSSRTCMILSAMTRLDVLFSTPIQPPAPCARAYMQDTCKPMRALFDCRPLSAVTAHHHGATGHGHRCKQPQYKKPTIGRHACMRHAHMYIPSLGLTKQGSLLHSDIVFQHNRLETVLPYTSRSKDREAHEGHATAAAPIPVLQNCLCTELPLLQNCLCRCSFESPLGQSGQLKRRFLLGHQLN